MHVDVDTLGHLLALKVTVAHEQERAQVGALAQQVQAATEGYVKIGYVDQGYRGAEPAAQAEQDDIDLMVIKLPEAKRGFVLLPRRWVVERTFPSLPASGGSGETMNASPKSSPAFIGALSSLSCLTRSSAKVHDTLKQATFLNMKIAY